MRKSSHPGSVTDTLQFSTSDLFPPDLFRTFPRVAWK
jgi:hypothetical protein